ncbi:low temperature requirement protein A [Rhodococcus gordoniae]
MTLLEMAVPLYAERAHPTPWHPHHIAERYGLLTLIVLGETIAAATVAVKSGIDEHEALGELVGAVGHCSARGRLYVPGSLGGALGGAGVAAG